MAIKRHDWVCLLVSEEHLYAKHLFMFPENPPSKSAQPGKGGTLRSYHAAYVCKPVLIRLVSMTRMKKRALTKGVPNSHT